MALSVLSCLLARAAVVAAMTAAAAAALMYCLLSGRLFGVSVTLFGAQRQVYTQAINDELSLLAPKSGKYGPHRQSTEHLA